jgi:hypothetical protein
VESNVANALENVPAAALPTTQVGSARALSVAEPGAGHEVAWFAVAERSMWIRARRDATTTLARADALPHDNDLLAWLSSSGLMERPPTDDICFSRHSSEGATQSDGSEAESVDEIFAGLASARLFDF